MLQKLIVIAFISFTFQASYADSTPKSVDAKAFAQRVQGTYKIEFAGGTAAKEENELADVFADEEEAAFTLPYCPPGQGCDPGYIFMKHAETTVEEVTNTDGSVVDTLTVTSGTKTRIYTWTENGGKVTFTNPQYMLKGVATTLEHVLVKQ